MLRLPPFEYLRPRTAAEAAEMIADHDGLAMAVAGGSDLLPKMKRRQIEPTRLVGLRGLAELAGICCEADGTLRIGAGETLATICADPEVARSAPALAAAAASVSTPQLRASGTLGGNVLVDTRCNYYDQTYEWRRALGFCFKKDGDWCPLAPGGHRCWSVSSSDTVPVLIALAASATLTGPAGSRTLPLEHLYQDDGLVPVRKQRDEILTSILIPRADGLRATYWKLRRRESFDFPILGVAAALDVQGGVVTRARIVLGAVASRPVRATAAEDLLTGGPLTEETIEEAANLAANPARPLDNTDLEHYWRKRMSRVYVRRALQQLARSGTPPS
jgi:4-hydroxybenzoyl-CoA reductase subunit beta